MSRVNGSMPRAVVADDEPTVKLHVSEMLTANGYHVVGSAPDGFEAVQLCRRFKPELVILDIQMPLVDGITAAKLIHKEGIGGCVLLLTAHSHKSMAKQAVGAGVMGYLTKPIDEDGLIPAIDVAMAAWGRMHRIGQDYQKTKKALDERKLIDVAKGLLMDKKGLSEQAAYQYMRKVAMDRECTVAQVAQMIQMSRL